MTDQTAGWRCAGCRRGSREPREMIQALELAPDAGQHISRPHDIATCLPWMGKYDGGAGIQVALLGVGAETRQNARKGSGRLGGKIVEIDVDDPFRITPAEHVDRACVPEIAVCRARQAHARAV